MFMPVLVFSVIAHEYAHGYAALKQGDDTALMLGRLTWNPVKHIDPFMTVLLPLVLSLVGAPILARRQAGAGGFAEIQEVQTGRYHRVARRRVRESARRHRMRAAHSHRRFRWSQPALAASRVLVSSRR